jgi:ABC-type ATPase involved in cell division
VDDAQAQAVIAELAALASQGRAVLVATHDARVADAAAVTRTWSLAAGRLVPQP